MRNKLSLCLLLLTLIAGLIIPHPNTSLASSHREAPLIVAEALRTGSKDQRINEHAAKIIQSES